MRITQYAKNKTKKQSLEKLKCSYASKQSNIKTIIIIILPFLGYLLLLVPGVFIEKNEYKNLFEVIILFCLLLQQNPE